VKVLVQKFGGTSVATDEARSRAVEKVTAAVRAGWSVVVVVSAIGRAGAPYATDTLIGVLKGIDPTTQPANRELDLMMACGEILSTVIFAQALRARDLDSIALTGGQAGILTDYEFGNARILSIDPTYVVKMLEVGKVVVVAGFQGATALGAITTLGRGGSDTTASALGAAIEPYAKEITVEIYTDVDGVKTADPRVVPGARTISHATYGVVAELAHQGAKVVHPRAAELAEQYDIPLWIKNTFTDEPGTLITREAPPGGRPLGAVGVTHIGKLAYLRFPTGGVSDADRGQIEAEIYRLLAREGIAIHLTSTGRAGFAFAVAREHLSRLRELIDGLIVPIDLGVQKRPPFGRIFLLGLGRGRAYEAQQTLLGRAAHLVEVHGIEAVLIENAALVSLVARDLAGLPGVLVALLETLQKARITVHQSADSRYSVSALVPRRFR
jgi:aspartate kinase